MANEPFTAGWSDRFNPEHPNFSVGDTGGYTGQSDPFSRARDTLRNLFYEEPKYAWELGNYYINGEAPSYIKSDGGIGGAGHDTEIPIDPPGDEDVAGLEEIFRKGLESGQPPGLAYTKPALGFQADPGYQKIYDQWQAEGSPVHKRGGIQSAREQFALRQALQAPRHLTPAPPEMDWGPAMDSIKDTGGYTVGDAGEAPNSGYMISLPGTEEVRPTESVTPETEADYHKRHWEQLFSDPDNSQGGWDNTGDFYTDISRNDQDLYRTVGDAVTTDQLGIYDLNQGQTLDTMDSPETDRDDYNPLLVSPGPIASRQAAVDQWPGKTTQERRDMWHNLGANMLADAEQNGLYDTPGSQSISAPKKDPGWRGKTCQNPEHSGEIGGRCADCGRRVAALGEDFIALLRQAGPLQYQDQFDESQYPSSPIDLPERKRRSLERKFVQPKKESLDPNMLDDRIDIDSLVKNALSRYRGATPEQVAEGRNWYATARARAEELARRTGGDFSKAAAIIAAMSPQMEWEGNLNAAAHFLNTYDPTRKHEWRRPNVSKQGLQAWNDLSGGRAPQSPEDFATLAKLHDQSDPDWAKEMSMPGRWDRASAKPSNKAWTGTGLPTLGDNVLRAMNVYDSDDPRELLDYAKGGPKIHSFWRNFLGDESFATIDKHMLRALERGYGEDPLLSYGSGKPEVTRKITPEDKRVNELEGLLGLTRTLKGDEQQAVPTGYNTYSEAIRRATSEANKERGPEDQLSAAQMQAIIWVQHKADMDAFRKRKSQEAFEQANPGKTYAPKPNTYVPGIPTNGPAPSYYETDEWADQNPYAGGTPRPRVPEFKGPAMSPDNIPDPELGPQEMGVMDPAPWADPQWSQPKHQLPKAAGRWSRRRELLRR